MLELFSDRTLDEIYLNFRDSYIYIYCWTNLCKSTQYCKYLFDHKYLLSFRCGSSQDIVERTWTALWSIPIFSLDGPQFPSDEESHLVVTVNVLYWLNYIKHTSYDHIIFSSLYHVCETALDLSGETLIFSCFISGNKKRTLLIFNKFWINFFYCCLLILV